MNNLKPATPLSFAESGALIAGGTSGVGLATARQLAAAGVERIALVARNAERGERARRAILAMAPAASVHFVAADANDADQARAACDRVRELIGSIDILVNATTAGFVPELFHKMPVADIPAILDQLVVAPLRMCRLVLPGMRERGAGVILNVASDAAKSATPGETVIGAGMAAIVMFSKALAIEAKRDGIRVNALTPSLIAGTMLTTTITKEGFSARLFEKAASLAHLGVPDADDIAAMIVFLAGPQGARITGQAISINGGISAA
ncbi:MAG: SDR family oxidoreductase [Rudaea sp.]|uniref:SDR family NAD(P)-dependent oxidoreductase n=1 Tax=Rudaea sp. TaxID=2136325 RepID=UPI0039E5512C